MSAVRGGDDDDDVTPGSLRLSKGVWLFAPDGVDVLLRVQPSPAPAVEGFLSQAVKGRLLVHGHLVDDAAAGDPVRPRTGVPALLVGTVRAATDDAIVLHAGVAFVVQGAGAAAAGSAVAVAVDVDRGVALELR